MNLKTLRYSGCAKNLFKSRLTFKNFTDAIGDYVAKPAFTRGITDFIGRSVLQDQVTHFLVWLKQFKNSDAVPVSGSQTKIATLARTEFFGFKGITIYSARFKFKNNILSLFNLF